MRFTKTKKAETSTYEKPKQEISLLLKYLVFASNFLFWLCGIGAVGLGVYVLASDYRPILDGLDVIVNPAIPLMVCGCLIFLIAFLGCFGALRENTLMLKLFGALLFMAYIGLVVVAFLVFLIFYSDTDTGISIEGFLMKAVVQYNSNSNKKFMIDFLQEELECCGISSVGYKDWKQAPEYNCSEKNVHIQRCWVPHSCCKKGLPGEPKISIACGQNALNKTNTQLESTLYTSGCLRLLQKAFEKHAVTVGAVVGAIIIPVCLSITLSNLLWKQIERQRYRLERQSRREERLKRKIRRRFRDPLSYKDHRNSFIPEPEIASSSNQVPKIEKRRSVELESGKGAPKTTLDLDPEGNLTGPSTSQAVASAHPVKESGRFRGRSRSNGKRAAYHKKSGKSKDRRPSRDRSLEPNRDMVEVVMETDPKATGGKVAVQSKIRHKKKRSKSDDPLPPSRARKRKSKERSASRGSKSGQHNPVNDDPKGSTALESPMERYSSRGPLLRKNSCGQSDSEIAQDNPSGRSLPRDSSEVNVIPAVDFVGPGVDKEEVGDRRRHRRKKRSGSRNNAPIPAVEATVPKQQNISKSRYPDSNANVILRDSGHLKSNKTNRLSGQLTSSDVVSHRTSGGSFLSGVDAAGPRSRKSEVQDRLSTVDESNSKTKAPPPGSALAAAAIFAVSEEEVYDTIHDGDCL